MKSITNIDNSVTGFVAGTLIHTKNGLVAIEQIKIGDYVLSKRENGDGEISYQKVIKTFAHDEQPVMCVDVYVYSVNDMSDVDSKIALADSSKKIPLIMTSNHPFWVVGRCWVKAEQLDFMSSLIQTINGEQHSLYDVSDTLRTNDPDIGFLVGGSSCPIKFSNSDSRAVNLKNNEIYTSYKFEDKIENEAVEWWDRNESDKLVRTVCNIEIENTHTYFVGEIGVFVHDNCQSKT